MTGMMVPHGPGYWPYIKPNFTGTLDWLRKFMYGPGPEQGGPSPSPLPPGFSTQPPVDPAAGAAGALVGAEFGGAGGGALNLPKVDIPALNIPPRTPLPNLEAARTGAMAGVKPITGSLSDEDRNNELIRLSLGMIMAGGQGANPLSSFASGASGAMDWADQLKERNRQIEVDNENRRLTEGARAEQSALGRYQMSATDRAAGVQEQGLNRAAAVQDTTLPHSLGALDAQTRASNASAALAGIKGSLYRSGRYPGMPGAGSMDPRTKLRAQLLMKLMDNPMVKDQGAALDKAEMLSRSAQRIYNPKTGQAGWLLPDGTAFADTDDGEE